MYLINDLLLFKYIRSDKPLVETDLCNANKQVSVEILDTRLKWKILLAADAIRTIVNICSSADISKFSYHMRTFTSIEDVPCTERTKNLNKLLNSHQKRIISTYKYERW